jgi:threonyl-tRNA synthetase
MTQPGASSHAAKTPRELLQAQGRLTPDVVAVRAGGEIVDLHTPVPEDTALDVVRLHDPAALPVIRHSTAHVMADAVQRLYPGTKVTFGPAVQNGF